MYSITHSVLESSRVEQQGTHEEGGECIMSLISCPYTRAHQTKPNQTKPCPSPEGGGSLGQHKNFLRPTVLLCG